jgi:hypothetical protein
MSRQRPALRLVHGASQPSGDWCWFCGHCAARGSDFAPPAPTARVCRACGLGLLLQTRRAVLPDPGDAFVVVDTGMRIQALSFAAERFLSLDEGQAVDRPVSELLLPADAQARDVPGLYAAIAEALSGEDEPTGVFVRPWHTSGVCLRAHVAPCAPPRAALVVLEESSMQRAVRGPEPQSVL